MLSLVAEEMSVIERKNRVLGSELRNLTIVVFSNNVQLIKKCFFIPIKEMKCFFIPTKGLFFFIICSYGFG